MAHAPRTWSRPSFGSRLEITAGGQRIIRDLFPANPGMGQNPPELLIGLGAAEKIEQLTIRWPTGREQTFKDLPVDSRLTFTEGRKEVSSQPLLGAQKR